MYVNFIGSQLLDLRDFPSLHFVESKDVLVAFSRRRSLALDRLRPYRRTSFGSGRASARRRAIQQFAASVLAKPIEE
jgi:hypothetical protein